MALFLNKDLEKWEKKGRTRVRYNETWAMLTFLIVPDEVLAHYR